MKSKYKVLIVTIVLLFNLPTNLISQENIRFLRIYGVSESELISEKMRVYFSVFEIKENTKSDVKERTFAESYEAFMNQLDKNGFDNNLLVKAPIKVNKFSSVKKERYFLDISIEDDLTGLYFKNEYGFKVDDIYFTFDETNNESRLCIDAINDAKQKVQIITEELGLKHGDIINIEDQSSGCCDKFREEKSSKVKLEYKVTVTFELLN